MQTKRGDQGDVGKKYVTPDLWGAESSGLRGIVRLPAKHYGLSDFGYAVTVHRKGCNV